MSADGLDEVDRGILYRLQEDARNNTATDIAEEVGVTANTVRNRIQRLVDRGIIKGYVPQIGYEQAGYQIQVVIRCTAPVSDRSEMAQAALDVDGVVHVRELMTGQRNVEVTVVGAESDEITHAAEQIHAIGFDIEEEELVKNTYMRPFKKFLDESDGET